MADKDTNQTTTPQDWWATPGTQRHSEIEAEELRDTGLVDSIKRGFDDIVAKRVIGTVQQESAELFPGGTSADPTGIASGVATVRALFGERAGSDEDYSAKYAELTTGVPAEYHDEILDEPNYAAAQRARGRIDAQLERAFRASKQHGVSAALGRMAGGIIDVDAPLMLVTGGGYKAAVVAGKALRAAKAVGLNPTAAVRAANAVVGANAGLQAGAVVGAVDAAVTETADWTAIADTALQGMLLGASLGGAANADMITVTKAAQTELYNRVATDDPSLRSNPAINPAYTQKIINSTAGAQQVTPSLGAPTTMLDGVSDEVKDLSQTADNWRHDSGWQERKDAVSDEWWTKVATHGLANVTTSGFKEMYTSNSSMLNMLLGTVFESPNGLGRGEVTAAALEPMYVKTISTNFVQPFESAASAYRRARGLKGLEARDAFNREVYLETNARQHGLPGTSDPHVQAAADAIDATSAKAHEIALGDPTNNMPGVDGFDKIPVQKGYTPRVTSGTKITQLMTAGVVKFDDVVQAWAAGYRRAGGSKHDSEIIARAIIQRAIAKSEGVDTNVSHLLTTDGRNWLNTVLDDAGIAQSEKEGLLRRLTGDMEMRGKESFAKHRTDVDLSQVVRTQDGSALQLVDLLDTDLGGQWHKYIRRMAGSAALARVGITNRTKISTIIDTVHAQQRALGEKQTPADMLRSMFSAFDGGPVKGWSSLSGTLEDGVMPEVALVKRAAHLSYLGKMGLAQGAELGPQIAATGFRNWWNRVRMQGILKHANADQKAMLNDLAFIGGPVGQDHHLFAPHMDYDEMSTTDRAMLFKYAQGLTQKGSKWLAYLNGFNAVRSWQQKLVATAISDKIFVALKRSLDAGSTDVDPALVPRLESDLGLFAGARTDLWNLVATGVIEFGTTPGGHLYVRRLNPDKWSPDVRQLFGAAVMRNESQLVQKALAGEQSPWISTTVGALLSELKTFPMLAMQKQFIRNVRHVDTTTLNALTFGMATAGLAVYTRDVIDGRERTSAEFAKAAFGYSNMTGWVPMVFDPTMSMLGLENMRFNQYNPNASFTPPSVDWAERAWRLPGAAVDKLTGSGDYADDQSLRALPYASLAGMNLILGTR